MNLTIEKTIAFVKDTLEGAEAGHDWFHVERVWKLSKIIAEHEECSPEIVELAALLHDIADPKFHHGDEELALQISSTFLKSIDVPKDQQDHILHIIRNMSFKNRTEQFHQTIELQIVQDADRLDALGAIGIARTFNFGGFKNNLMYDPQIPPKINMSKEEYKKYNGTTINHFYEKLLLLKDLMHTPTAKKIASERHDFMVKFLDQFYQEWEVRI